MNQKHRQLLKEIEQATGEDFSGYYHPFFGFNICKFDDQRLQSPDGESVRDAITKRWGKTVADKFAELLKVGGGARTWFPPRFGRRVLPLP